MTSFAQAVADVRDTWEALETALELGNPDETFAAALDWWLAREALRAAILEPAS